METFGSLPGAAAWRHVGSREGFEVVFLSDRGDGIGMTGATTAVTDGSPWWVRYAIELDAAWRTRRALVRGHSAAGERETVIEADGAGAWTVDGTPRPELDGIVDVDLEASALTNALPVHRMALEPGVCTDAPAAWVRIAGLSVERLEQTYTRLGARRFGYTAPASGFRAELRYDDAGLVLRYPCIAERVF